MLIALSGLDGTGKSAQVERLSDALRQSGRDVSTIWYRPGYGRVADGLRAAVRRVRPDALPAPGEAAAQREGAFARPAVQWIWLWLAVLGSMWTYGVRARLDRRRVLVFDRWVDDGVIDLDLRFAAVEVRRWWPVRLLGAVAARPDVHVLLEAPEELLASRLSDKNEPFPDPPDRRRRRVDAYQALDAAATHDVVVDASGDVDQVARRVRDRVERITGHRFRHVPR